MPILVALAATLTLLPTADTPAAGQAADPGDIESVQLSLLAHHDLAAPGLDGQVKPRGQNGDVTVLGDTVFVGGGALFHGAQNTSGRICTDWGGVKVVDISDPTAPVLQTTITIEDVSGVGPPWPATNPRRGQRFDNVSVSAGALDSLSVSTAAFRGDLLAIATQRCETSFFFGARLEFWDVTDRANPTKLGEFDPATIANPTPGGSPATGQWGIFEDVRLFPRGDRLYAVATTPFSIGNAHDASPFGDFRLVDITDPREPQQVGTFPPVSVGEGSVNGCRTFLAGRAAAPTPDHEHAIVSFYDGASVFTSPTDPRSAALFELDLDDLPTVVPGSNPLRFNPTPQHWGYTPDPTVEGNVADVEPFTAADGRLLVAASEDDIDPALTYLSISAPTAAVGEWRGCQSPIGQHVYELPGQQLAAPLVYVGRGCPASPLTGTSNLAEDEFLTDPAGKIALLDPGPSPFDGCSTVERADRAIAAGAVAVLINAGSNPPLNSANNGPPGGIPSQPVVAVPLDAYRAVQYVPNPVLAAPSAFNPDPFPATWERSSTTNVDVAAVPADTRVDKGRFRSVADTDDRDARGEVGPENRFAVAPGQDYATGAFLEVASLVAGAFRAAVVWYSAAGAAIGESEIASLAAATPRQRYEAVVTAPADAVTATVKFEWNDGVDEGTTADVDEGTAYADAFEFGPTGIQATVRDEQGAWGAQRIIDFSQDPPREIGSYRSPMSGRWPPPDDGIYQPELYRQFGTDLAFTTWMSDGLRVLDVSDPTAPREVAAYVPPAVADPAPRAGAGSTATPPLRTSPSPQLRRRQVWPNQPLVTGVDVRATGDDTGVVALSDINGGLYVLGFRVSRAGEPAPPPPGTSGAVRRLSGAGRIETAAAVSQASFVAGSADAVVLARADVYADALAGTPLAVARNAPLLLTPSDQLHPATQEELTRVLPRGSPVHLLGGPTALTDAVRTAVEALGYRTERIAGPTRVETAVEVAQSLGQPDPLLVTTGYDFPDALAAGAAAAHTEGAVLLTIGDQRHPTTDAYLDARPAARRYAVGGPAARPYPDATAVVGPTREETAVEVAGTFFSAPTVVGVARRDVFADALAGGAHIARLGGPILLTPSTVLHESPQGYLCAHAEQIDGAYVYGGRAAISAEVVDAIAARIAGRGC
ncbi:MAG TPA: cell wall-binding repeat-containing protein [Nitriliruptorales bacterium]|nr:cell wall-binding repeat-containing protein [Nitriliruptorales bacterium]